MSEIKDIIFSDSAIRSSMPIVISSRIRLARNFKSYRFPYYADANDLTEVANICKNILVGCKLLKDPKIFEISKLKSREKFSLVESHLCSVELIKSDKNSFLLVSNNNSVVIMVNEEDHLRLQVFSRDLDFKNLWMTISEIDDYISSSVDIAYDEVYGFLTSCPTNVGTGMRGSVMMHLPGLTLGGQIFSVISAIQKLGFIVRGIYGEGSNSLGSIFQISNQHTLGLSEVDILSRLHQIIMSVIENEEIARKILLKNRYTLLRDTIGRSFGLLANSYIMGENEAINHLSNIRLAIDLGYLESDYRCHIDNLMTSIQQSHIKVLLNLDSNDVECDIKRADILKKVFTSIPTLQF